MEKVITASVLAVALAAQAKPINWGKVFVGAAATGAAVYVANRMAQPSQPQQQQPAEAAQPPQLPAPPQGYVYVQQIEPKCNCPLWVLRKAQ